ncbi:MAG: sigma-70 family RNA polymerase sigma factor [Acidobacteriia bacterium]|nr:sigma-70 family RNA polymerase sigma factor [Terriglobia bacterium]
MACSGIRSKRLSLWKAEFANSKYHFILDGNTPPPDGSPVTQVLKTWKPNDTESAGQVVAALYRELHRMAARLLAKDRPGHTLQPTALIHELYLRLAVSQTPDWGGRTHFFAVAAATLRRVLIDHARAHRARKRGAGEAPVPLELAEAGTPCSYDDLLAIDEALELLEQADPRAARVTELRFFGGLQEKEIAAELGVAEITVKRDWKFARAWLAAHLGNE